jgi:hypothetical protein
LCQNPVPFALLTTAGTYSGSRGVVGVSGRWRQLEGGVLYFHGFVTSSNASSRCRARAHSPRAHTFPCNCLLRQLWSYHRYSLPLLSAMVIVRTGRCFFRPFQAKSLPGDNSTSGPIRRNSDRSRLPILHHLIHFIRVHFPSTSSVRCCRVLRTFVLPDRHMRPAPALISLSHNSGAARRHWIYRDEIPHN